jgi:hypothetical protein
MILIVHLLVIIKNKKYKCNIYISTSFVGFYTKLDVGPFESKHVADGQKRMIT